MSERLPTAVPAPRPAAARRSGPGRLVLLALLIASVGLSGCD